MNSLLTNWQYMQLPPEEREAYARKIVIERMADLFTPIVKRMINERRRITHKTEIKEQHHERPTLQHFKPPRRP